MPLSEEDRGVIASAFEDSMPTIEEVFHIYCGKTGVPERFSIEGFDASDSGQENAAGGEPAARAIAVHTIKTVDWGERNFTDTARRKARAALRTGRDSGDLVRNAKELFQEGDAANPGACRADVAGKQICVATSGLRGTEDEAFALLVIELMK